MIGALEFTKIFGGFALLAAVLGVIPQANAFTLTSFTDRESWESAVEGSFSEETFNSYTADTSFNDISLDIGDFTLKGTGASSRQKIDAASLDVPLFDVDGTSMILGQTDNISSFSITFDFPVTAFGADFSDISSQGITQLSAKSTLVGSIPQNTQFFGFIADENFNKIELNSANAYFDGFGMDNFVYVPLNSSPTRSFSLNSDIVNLFDPVELSPARGMPLTFDNVQNAPFNFSPTLGLLSVGGIWLLSHLRKKFYR